MKRLTLFAVAGSIACGCLVFSACERIKLETPTDLYVDVENTMYWSEVENARIYQINIFNVETNETTVKTSRRAEFSLSDLETGDYDITVTAAAGEDNRILSQPSTVLYFEKVYETGCVYELIDNYEYVIKSVGEATGTVVIDGEYRGKPVTRIAENAFKSSRTVEHIEIKENVKQIGWNAFYNCIALESVTLPKGLHVIEDAAFNSCRVLKNIVIPEGVTTLAPNLFEYCVALESVTLPNGLKTISKKAFNNCQALTEIDIPDSVTEIGESAFASTTAMTKAVIGENVGKIGKTAFKQSTIATIEFDAKCKLTTIDESAFEGCAELTAVTLPSGVLRIEDTAFFGCTKLATIDLSSSLIHTGIQAFVDTAAYTPDEFGVYYIDDWLVAVDSEKRDEVVNINNGKMYDGNGGVIATIRANTVGIGGSAFKGAKKIDTVNLPSNIRALSDQAFYNSTIGRLITTSSQLKVIGKYAFASCDNFNVLTLNSGLEVIEDNAFFGCLNLNNKNNLIPESVVRIGKSAFKGTGLWETQSTAENGDGVIYAGNWIVGFAELKSANLTAKPGTKGIADYAFSKAEDIISFNLNGVTHLGKGAFYKCPALSSVMLGFNVKAIEDYTFYQCEALLTVGMPTSLTKVGNYAFYQCSRLEGIDLSNCLFLTKIGDYAFYGASAMKNALLSTAVTHIGRGAFYGNTSLGQIVVPDSVTEIGDYAFSRCTSAKTLTIGSGVTTIGNYAFSKCESLTDIVIPANVTTIGNYAFYKCIAMKNLSLAEGLKNIGDYAFYYEKLTDFAPTVLQLPKSVKEIGMYAFKGFDELTSLTLSKDIKYIGGFAFYGNKQITIYTDATADNGWEARWNSNYRPVVWGCELSADGKYVLSVQVTEDTLLYTEADGGIVAPEREGYTFSGWIVEGTQTRYNANELQNVPVGTKLIADWTIKQAE